MLIKLDDCVFVIILIRVCQGMSRDYCFDCQVKWKNQQREEKD